MKNKINFKRVRRIKAGIYLFLLLLILIPAILMIVVGVKILGRLDSGAAAGIAGSAPALAGAPDSTGGRPEESIVFDANPLGASPTQLPVPEPSSAAEESERSAGGSGSSEPSGGANAQPSQGSEAEEGGIGAEEPFPQGQAGGEGSPDAPLSTSTGRYGDTEIPNTGFPKPGEAAW